MTRYIIKRILLGLFTMLAILFVSYVMLRLTPGDPTRSNLFGGADATAGLNAEKGALKRNQSLREKLDLDKPILTGFANWFGKIIRHGDFGTSASVDPGRPITDIIRERLPITLSLNFWAVLITYLLAIPIGVYAAVYADSPGDKISSFMLFLLYSLPGMWVALLLQSTFCEGGKYPFFPLKGLTPGNLEALNIWQLLGETIRYYTLPVLCLAYGGFAGLSRYARSGMLDVIHNDYIRTARAKGLSEPAVIWKHAFRNALITLITLFGGLLPGLVAGSVIIEYVFNIPGMGSLSLLSLTSRDYPLQMALFTFAGALTLIGIFISDMLYMLADPRIKLQ